MADRPPQRLRVEQLEDRLTQSTAAPLDPLYFLQSAIKPAVTGVRPVSVASLQSMTSTAPSPLPTTASQPAVDPIAMPLRRRRVAFADVIRRSAPSSTSTTTSTTASTSTTSTTTTSVTQTMQFSVSDLKPSDPQKAVAGFSVGQAVVHADGSTSAVTLSFTLKSTTQQGANTLLETWQTSNGEVTVTATLTTQGTDRLMDVNVAAANGWNVDSIELGGPRVYTPISSDLRTYGAFKGGQVMPWSASGYVQQNSSSWPAMGYSPLGVFYNQKTTEGVGFIAFDGGLERRDVFWVTGPGEVDPYVRWYCNLKSGQNATTHLAEHHAFNMPTDGFKYYRDNFLIPFMQSQGIAEGTINVSKPVALSYWPTDGNVATSVRTAVAQGSTGLLQYAPPDGISYYEPNPETLSWYPSLKLASQNSSLSLLGVLIDPFKKSRATSPTSDPTSPNWFPGGSGDLSLLDPDAQRFTARLRDDLAAQGVNFAFWDTGSGPRTGEGLAWFNILKSWKQAGISIAPESSCDIASYVTGTNLFDQFHDDYDYSLVTTVTPIAKPVVLDRRQTSTNGKYWWDLATAKGLIPLLDDQQMITWAKQQRTH